MKLKKMSMLFNRKSENADAHSEPDQTSNMDHFSHIFPS